MPSDPYNLTRFVQAQENAYPAALRELQNGQKRSHWMWFIFPQIQGLGFSPTAQHYAVRGVEEARAYLAHPLLGPRLAECTVTVNSVAGRSVTQVFGYPDHLKFRSSMTLFELAAGTDSEFSKALDKHCSGERDQATLDIVRASGR